MVDAIAADMLAARNASVWRSIHWRRHGRHQVGIDGRDRRLQRLHHQRRIRGGPDQSGSRRRSEGNGRY
jgi:hypothetical protein